MVAKKIVPELDHSKHRIDTITQPFGLIEKDPQFKPPSPAPAPPKVLVNRGKPKKVLTNRNLFARLRSVNIIKSRKGDKIMATDKQKTSKKSNRLEIVKSLAWLVEAAFRGFVGYVLLAHFNNYVTTVAATYALVTAGVIVVGHFVRAHR